MLKKRPVLMCLPCLANKGVAKFAQTKTESAVLNLPPPL